MPLNNTCSHVFVAGFIGSPQMNFIECKIKKKNQDYYAVFEYYSIKLPGRMNDYLLMYEDKDVILGIRPENMSIAENNCKENTIDLYVDIAEMTGSDYYLYGLIGDEKIIANVSANSQVKSDTKCKLAIDTEKIHIFDKISEKLICD